MVSDFFLGFAGYAHTMNELETDQQRELEMRIRNSPEEAQKLTGMILDKLEKDLSDSGYPLERCEAVDLVSGLGITLHSKTAATKLKEKKKGIGIKGWIKGPVEE